jgi:hypothetical protein
VACSIADRHSHACAQVTVTAPTRQRLALLAAGAIASLASGCASTLGWDTPCSAWVSMDNADQRSTVVNIFQMQSGTDFTSAEVSQFQQQASDYCADPNSNQPTIIGMLDSRPS